MTATGPRSGWSWPAYRQRAGACLFQRAQVLGDISLERQHPDHGLLGRRHGGGRLPAAAGVVLFGGQRVQVDADHGLAQPARDLGDDVRPVADDPCQP